VPANHSGTMHIFTQDGGFYGNFTRLQHKEVILMAKYEVITPSQAREEVETNDALLVCAYESEEKFKSNALQGAISLHNFKRKEASLPKEKEIIFYCN